MSQTTDQDVDQTRALSAPKGTYDLLPPRSEAFAHVTSTYSDAAAAGR